MEIKLNLNDVDFILQSPHTIFIPHANLVSYICDILSEEPTADIIKCGWELVLEFGKTDVQLSDYGKEPEKSLEIYIDDHFDYKMIPVSDGLEIELYNTVEVEI